MMGWIRLGTVFAMVCVVISVAGIGARDRTATAQDAGPSDAPMVVTGAGTCRRCHTQPAPDEQFTDVVLLTEYAIWKNRDYHEHAFAALETPRSLRMAKALGYKRSPAQEPACVACHGVATSESVHAGPLFRPEEGITCVVCHGARESWIKEHWFDSAQWREFSAEQKETKFGLTNLRSAARRAETCASCHVGAADQGKVLTHEMYAAGHPMLPGFELVTFCDSMPPHWEPLRDKSEAVRKLLGYDPEGFDDTRAVLIGGAVAFREAAELLASEATRGAAAQGEWPSLAQFDCTACHHDLRVPSWRQERGYAGKPGRPRVKFPTAPLVEIAVRFASSDPAAVESLERAYRTRLDALNVALDKTPYGNATEVAQVAEQLASWSDRLIESLGSRRLDRGASSAILSEACSRAAGQPLDLEAACVLASALKPIHRELFPEADPVLYAEIDAVVPIRPRFPTKSNQDGVPKPFDDLTNEIEAARGQWLRRASEFDLEKFRELMRRIASEASPDGTQPAP